MSIFDKLVAAVTPPESEEDRREARAKATKAARPGDWLDNVLQHHMDIEDAFLEVKAANHAAPRIDALGKLACVLNGHSIAEEIVLYPVLAENGEKTHAGMGYQEQAMVKIQMAELEKMEPMSQDFIDKLEHVEGAVKHHIYQEEGTWLLEIKEKLSPEEQALITARYNQEYERYVGEKVGA